MVVKLQQKTNECRDWTMETGHCIQQTTRPKTVYYLNTIKTLSCNMRTKKFLRECIRKTIIICDAAFALHRFVEIQQEKRFSSRQPQTDPGGDYPLNGFVWRFLLVSQASRNASHVTLSTFNRALLTRSHSVNTFAACCHRLMRCPPCGPRWWLVMNSYKT